MIRRLLLKSRRDIRASLAQTIALVVIVALGIASFTALLGAYRDLGSSYNHTYDELRFADIDFSLQQGNEAALEAVRKVDGVKAATGRLVIDTTYDLPGDGGAGDQIRSRLIGMPADRQPDVNSVLIESGSYFAPGDPNQALVDTHFAEFYGIKPGDTVTPLINGQISDLHVSGIITSPEYLIASPSKQDILPSARSFAVLFVPLEALQSLTGNPGVINDIAVTLTDGANADAVTADIRKILEPYGVKEVTPRSEQPSYAALKLDLDGYREIAYLMPGIILLVAAASVYVMISRHVRAQQPQIGVMKALGYGNGPIIFHYLAVALFIGLSGSIIGSLGGIPLERALTGYYASDLGIPLVETHIYFSLLLGGALLSLGITALAGLGPALSVTRMLPARAMHMDPASAHIKGREVFLEKLLPMPFWPRLALRNVFRVRRRSLSTAMGVIFAFMLLMMSWGMIDSINYMLSHTFDDVELWDMTANFNSPQTDATLSEIRSWQGVNKAEPFLQLPAAISANGHSSNILLSAIQPDQTLHKLELSGGVSPVDALAPGKIVLTTTTADSLQVKEGDKVTVTSAQLSRELEVSSTVPELMSSVAYVSLDSLTQAEGLARPVFNGLRLSVAPDATQTVKSDLNYLPGAAGIQEKSVMSSDWRTLMSFFYVFIGVIMAFAVAMAFALLFNTMTVNVLEQQRELATMRAVGTGDGRITWQLTMENTILWLFSLLPGLLLGYLVTLQLGKAFQSDIFSLQIHILPSTYFLTALGILATMLLAALPAIRRISRLNLAEATKILN